MRKNNKNQASQENYVEHIPVICEDKPWEVLEAGLVEITVENTGFYNLIAQKLFKRPRFSFIKLDEYGSFVWQQIDGQRSIYDIGQSLGSTHSGASNQLYERLCKYFGILKSHNFITFKE